MQSFKGASGDPKKAKADAPPKQIFKIDEATIKGSYSVVGSGSKWVYCYYFPYVRAAQEGARRHIWPCKIGRTSEDNPKKRIAAQFSKDGITGFFEAPEICFAAMTKNEIDLENSFEDELEYCNMRKNGFDAGREWYETHPKIVRRAYRKIMWPKLRQRPKRVVMFIKMELDALRVERARP